MSMNEAEEETLPVLVLRESSTSFTFSLDRSLETMFWVGCLLMLELLSVNILGHLDVCGPGVAPGDEAKGEGGDDEPDHPAADRHQGVGGHHGPLLVGSHDVLGPDVPVGRLKDLSARTEDGSKLGVSGGYGHTWGIWRPCKGYLYQNGPPWRT